MDQNKKINLSLIQFDPTDIQTITDKKPVSNTGLYVPYGIKNDYPDMLNMLYSNSGVFASIINSICDYTGGSKFYLAPDIMQSLYFNSEVEARDIIRRCIFDRILTGGFCLKLIYNLNQNLAKIQWMDIRDVRLSFDGRRAYYALNFGKGRRGELEVYSTFDHFVPAQDEHNQYACIYYHKGRSRGVYPYPSYQGALRAIQTDCEISKFNLRQIYSGMSAGAVINVPNGDAYSEDEKREIERKFKENFCGSDNADSIILSFNPSSEDKVEIAKVEDDSFADKFEALQKSTIKNIFSAFRMSPVLAGYLSENIGFNRQEFAESASIFQQTVIAPIQRELIESFAHLFNRTDALTIEPFKINLND